MLQIKDLTYRIAGRTLLDGASLHVPVGHRFGLIGRNGTGKSTLFKLITGELHADGGSIELRKGARLGVLPQEAPGGPESLTYFWSIRGDAEAGCSVHLVTPELDDGPVLGQTEVSIAPDDTPESLAARVLVEEHRLYPAVLRQFCTQFRRV